MQLVRLIPGEHMATAPGQIRSSVVVFLILLGGAAGWAAWYMVLSPKPPEPVAEVPEPVPDPPTPDPRVTFPTPFRNVRPEVRYLGDASCMPCHADVCKKYHTHPMGRSAAFAGQASPLEEYTPAAKPVFRSGPYELRVEQTATGVVHRVSARDSTGALLPDYVVTPELVIGSGTQGRSYLTIQQGAVWQSPVSWFTPERRWDVSPGFDLGNGGRRPILPECLYCHVDRVEPVRGAMNRYREPLLALQTSIGCERCHGPGELHVLERSGGPPAAPVDHTIVNPRHLPPALQASVCEQCHLQGEERVARRGRSIHEFRPGLPFEQFVTVFVRPPESAQMHRSVGQFEQLELSRCTTPTGGRLVCTTCHDPHVKPATADREAFYRNRCQTCHESKGCTHPAADRAVKNDSCIACHMPTTGSANIVHASVTDHRIVRRAGQSPPRLPMAGQMPLIPFRSGPYSPPPPEAERDLGIALARAAARIPPGPDGMRELIGRLARDRLATSLATWRGDADAWLGMNFARLACRELPERLEAATIATKLLPNSESAFQEQCDAAFELGNWELALQAVSKLVAFSPTSPEPLFTRAAIHLRLSNWEKAESDCRAGLAIHPLHPRGRLLLGICLHRRGNPEAGRKEAETAASLTTRPGQRAAFLEWYQRETR